MQLCDQYIIHLLNYVYTNMHVTSTVYACSACYIELNRFWQQIQFVFRILTISPSGENDTLTLEELFHPLNNSKSQSLISGRALSTRPQLTCITM